jgi:RNA polymerase sigma factor (sigma-70 family)
MIVAMTEPLDVGEQPEEFTAVYARLHRDVFRYCLVLTRSVEDAEDVAGETFERGLRAWRFGRAAAGQPLPWLLLIARRIVIDRARRRRLLRWLPLSAAPAVRAAAPLEAERIEFWLWFDRLSDALTSRQREVLLLRYQSDLTDAEIGRILGLSEPGVRSLASRAISSLRQHPELLR